MSGWSRPVPANHTPVCQPPRRDSRARSAPARDPARASARSRWGTASWPRFCHLLQVVTETRAVLT
jgi:hypothetical protein